MKIRSLLITTLPIILIISLFLFWYFHLRIASYSESRLMMGTVVEISALGKSEADLKEALDAAFAAMAEVERIADRHLETSELSRINREASRAPVEVSPALFDILVIAEEVSDRSGGAFDVTVAPLVDMWDFEGGGRVPNVGEIERVMGVIGHWGIILDREKKTVFFTKAGTKIDLGGVAKGYAVTKAEETLRELGVKHATVNAGGDIGIIGDRMGRPWRVGVQNPRNPDGMVAILSLRDIAVVTSGDYERFFFENGVRYHHILDPKTGFPAGECRSVTVVYPDAAWADAFATALFVLGPKKALTLARDIPLLDVLIVDANGEIFTTPSISDYCEIVKP